MQDNRVPYVAVNEGRRSQVKHGSLKNFDFIVFSPTNSGNHLVFVDVKGSAVESTAVNGKDLSGFERWKKEGIIPRYGTMIFAFVWGKGREKQISCVDFDAYKLHMEQAGVWHNEKRYKVPTREFRILAKPVSEFIPQIK